MFNRGLHVRTFKRYCVTFSDNWTPLKLFWTLEGAKRCYRERRSCANVFKWEGGAWAWMCGAKDAERPVFTSPTAVSEFAAWR
jgi:hypothetical protein